MNDTKDRPGASELNRLADQTFSRPVRALADARAKGVIPDTGHNHVETTLLATLLGLGQLVITGKMANRELDNAVTTTVGAVVAGLGQSAASSPKTRTHG